MGIGINLVWLINLVLMVFSEDGNFNDFDDLDMYYFLILIFLLL